MKSGSYLDASVPEPFTKAERARHELWKALHGIAWALVIDPSPRVQDHLLLLHVLTDPAIRRDPRAGAEQLERVIAAHSGNLTFEKYLGKAIAALGKYAMVVGDHGERSEGRGGPSNGGAADVGHEAACETGTSADRPSSPEMAVV